MNHLEIALLVLLVWAVSALIVAWLHAWRNSRAATDDIYFAAMVGPFAFLILAGSWLYYRGGGEALWFRLRRWWLS